MSNIEEQNLTEFLLEVKAKMANITTSENIEINNICLLYTSDAADE